MIKLEKKKKPFYKKWWFITLAVVVILAAIGSQGDDKKSATEDKVIETTAPVKETKEKPKKEKKEEVNGIGTATEVGDAVFTLNSVELADQVGPSVLPTKASGKYVVLDVTYKNNGNEAVIMDSSFFKLIRGEKKYEADAMGSMSANQGEDGAIENSFFLQEINPDSEIKGKVVFDVAPEVAEATDLQLQVQTGIFGTETGLISLK